MRTARASRDRICVLVGALVVASAVAAVAPAARAAVGEIHTVAGSLGEGAATTIAQSPVAVAVKGALVYTAEQRLVRVLDLRTGMSRVVAGDGRLGFAGDGGPATAASFADIGGLAVDDAGNVYIADSGNQRVRRVGADGVVTTYAGGGSSRADGGPATGARLDNVRGLAFDAAGDLHLADNYRIRRVDRQGRITTVAGNDTYGFSGDGGPATSAQLLPADLAFDELGNMFIADRGNNRIRKVTPDGTISTVAGTGMFQPVVDGGPATSSGLAYPDALAVRDGSVYVNGMDNRSVRRIGPDGIITTIAGNGQYGDAGDGGPGLAASLQAYGLDFDADGNLYMADWFNNRLRRLDPGGTISTAAGNGTSTYGGDGGPAAKAQIGPRTRMAFDAAGNLFVADVVNDAVRRIDPSGTITTVARPDFSLVGGLAFDAAGRLYIGESGKNRVVRLEADGSLTVVAGGRYGDAGDGGPAIDAAMYLPASLDFDAAGNLYILDYRHGAWNASARIRKVDATGTITTLVQLAPCTGAGGDMEFDGDGRLLVTDDGGVLRVDADGAATRVAGGPGGVLEDGVPATHANALCPGGVTSDAAGNVYVGDSEHGRVRRIDTHGIISTVAGGGDVFNSDGGPATSATLWFSTGFADLALDKAGDLYVSTASQVVGDPGRIRRIERPGAIPSVTTTSTSSTTTSTSTTSTSSSTSTSTTTTTVPTAVKASGMNNVGQLGNGSTTDARAPVAAATPPGVTAVAAGFYHSLFRQSDGTVSASGWNVFGQLGTGTTTDSPTPVKVAGLSGVRQVSAGAYHSLALKDDGTVWAWGYNGFGELGTGTTTDSRVPVQVPGLTGVVAVAAGAVHNLALKADGTVWAWGWNALSQLGTASGTDARLPNKVQGLTGVTAVTAGGYHSLAQRADGSVWAWGWNQYGQLGTGSAAAMSATPAAIPGLTEVRSLAAGLNHTLAAKADGTAWAWGMNHVGQVGTGATTDSRVPVKVAGLSAVGMVGAGAYHSMAARADGTAWAWGWNYFGQLGTATAADARVPVPAPGFARPRAVAGGMGHTVAITA